MTHATDSNLADSKQAKNHPRRRLDHLTDLSDGFDQWDMIPRKLTRAYIDGKFPESKFRLLLCMMSHSGGFHVKRSYLEERFSPNTLSKYVSELTKEGYISLESILNTAGRSINLYHVRPLSDWKVYGQNVDPIASEVRNSVEPIASEAIAKKEYKDPNLKDFNSDLNPTVKTRVREVPESERREPETRNPFEPTIGNPDHVLQRLEHGVSLKSADYKRTDNYVELGAQPILVKNTRGGSTEFGTRGSTEFGTPFTPASSPKNLNPTVKTRVREVPESERREPETKNPFEPTIGNPDHKVAIAKMVEDGRNQGLMIKPDDLARSIGLAIQNLGTTFPAIKEIWPLAVAGMLERLERNPATGFFNWIKADLAYKERQRQIDERQAAKSSHGKNRKNMQESMPAPNVELSEEEENLRQKKKAEMRKLLFPDKAHI